jgi:6-phosphogluconate dehydrogenase
MLSAMRFGFGGHAEGQESIDPQPKLKNSQGHSAAPNAAE